MKNKFPIFAGCFFLLFILFFPLDFLGSFQRNISQFLFGNFAKLVSASVFGKENIRVDFSSDSLSMFILMGFLLMISIMISVFIPPKYFIKRNEISKEIICIYLAIVLLKYGFDKVFKAQFYLPEPNILYSRFGNLDRDILFWSTMGISRTYSVFSGIVEVSAAVFLMFRKTKIVGLMLSAGIFLNILFINLGFDISVKLFSLILFLMTLFAAKDDIWNIYRFLILKKRERLGGNRLFQNTKFQPVFVFAKTAVLGLSAAAILFPYFNFENFNDDAQKRPFLHGAFKVLDKNSETKYLFFHRKHYLIFMNENGETKDFHYFQNTSEHTILLEDYSGNRKEIGFFYSKKDSLLILDFDGKKIRAKEQNLQKMNALKPIFHFATESAE
ncbi:MAG: hypothetical protein LBE36_04470 [Flavobacteriaceae bacterium]|nr:hypothetical protein [Flavobacteriaceae bacterium]